MVLPGRLVYDPRAALTCFGARATVARNEDKDAVGRHISPGALRFRNRGLR